MPHSSFDNSGRPLYPRHVLVPVGETWRDRAVCRDHPKLNPEAWDDSAMDETGKYGASQRTQRIAAAIKVCETECPVREECLRDADLEWDEGVRGGVDLRSLKKLKGKAS